MSNSQKLLDVSGLSVTYGRIVALRDVSLHVAPGEIVAILGANGAGKTTLLNAITGILPLQSGKITFLGENTTGKKPWVMCRRGLSHVPEGREIFPGMTVEANLKLIDVDGGGSKFTVEDILDLFPRLRERYTSLGGALSGGEQQMLAIGRGLMSSPKLILFDEPSLGLSPMLSKAVLAAIRGLKERGIASLLVEQNVRAALRIADRAYVIRVGSITAEGSAGALAQSPDIQSAYLGL